MLFAFKRLRECAYGPTTKQESRAEKNGSNKVEKIAGIGFMRFSASKKKSSRIRDAVICYMVLQVLHIVHVVWANVHHEQNANSLFNFIETAMARDGKTTEASTRQRRRHSIRLQRNGFRNDANCVYFIRARVRAQEWEGRGIYNDCKNGNVFTNARRGKCFLMRATFRPFLTFLTYLYVCTSDVLLWDSRAATAAVV